MTVHAQRRLALLRGLEEVLGPERAATLMELLPPTGGEDLARRQDLDDLGARLDTRFEQIDARFGRVEARFEQIEARFEQVEARFEQVDARFEQVDARFEQVEARFEGLEARMASGFEAVDARFEMLAEHMEAGFAIVRSGMGEMRADLLGAMEARINAALVSQTRLILFSMVAYFVALAGLFLTLGG
jgi:hypothetical protein